MNGLKQNNITILGSGTSTGTPIIGCHCKTCLSDHPHDKRLRASIFLRTKQNHHILVDATPDLRYQLLRQKIQYIDFVLISHEHADHVHGIDDLRQICFQKTKQELDIYCAQLHQPYLVERFPYIFQREKFFNKDRPILGGGIPILKLKAFELKDQIKHLEIMGEPFTFFLLPHNYTKTVCFYHDGFAYLPDCYEVTANVVDFLTQQKLRLLIINCLQKQDHQTHLTVEKSFAYIHKIRPAQAGLIHMNHNLSHEELTRLAKENFDFPVFPVYDTQNLNY